MAKKLKITQVRSIIGSQEKKHKRVMTSLGFTKNYATLYKNDSPQIRGMLHKVRHLVEWEEIAEKVGEKVHAGIKSWLDEHRKEEKDWDEIADKVEEKIKKVLRDWAEK